MAIPPPPGYGGSGASGSGRRSSGGGRIPKPPGYRGTASGQRTAGTRIPKPSGTKLAPGVAQAQTAGLGQTAVQSAKATGKASGGSVFGDLLGQVSDIIQSGPSAVTGLVADVAREGFGEVPHFIHGVTHGNPEEVVRSIPVVGQGYALARGAGVGENQGSVNEQNPFSSAFGASFRNTYEDIRDPERFVDAYNQHRIVAKILEDTANASIVAGGASKLLNVASRGAFVRAATAGNTAEALDAQVAATTKTYQGLAERAAADEAALGQVETLVPEAARAHPGPAAQTFDKVRAAAADSARAAEDYRTHLEELQQRAMTAHDAAQQALGKGGAAYNTYRTLRTISNLGAQGANLPAKPFEYAFRALTKGTRSFLESNPALKAGIEAFDEKVGLAKAAEAIRNARQRGEATRVIQTGVDAPMVRDMSTIERVMKRAERIAGGDNRIFQAALAVDDVGQVMHDTLQTAGVDPTAYVGAMQRMEEITRAAGYDPGALSLSLQIAAGTADPQIAARVQAIQDLWDRRVKPIQERLLVESGGPGRRRAPAPGQEAMAEWNLRPAQAETVTNEVGPTTAIGLPPGRLEGLKRMESGRLAQLQEYRGETVNRLQAQLEKAGLPGLRSVEPGTTPGGGPTWRFRGSPEATIGANIGDQRAGGRVPGVLRRIQRAAKAEGRLGVAQAASERLRLLREAIPASVGDDVVQRLSDAIGRLDEAQQRLTDPGLRIEDLPAKEVEAEVRNFRTSAVELARAERASMPPGIPETLPFIPGDMSSLWAGLNDDLLKGHRTNAGDLRIADQLKNVKGKALTDEERFVRAYSQLYNKLPKQLQGVLTKLDDAEVRDMFRRRGRGLHELELGNLDRLSGEYAQAPGVAETLGGVPEGEAAARAMLDDFAHAKRLEGFAKRGGHGGWDSSAVEAVLASTRDSALAEALRDPEARAMLGRGNLNVAAQDLLKARRDAAEAKAGTALELPNVKRVVDAAADKPFPLSEEDALDAIAVGYGGYQTPEFERFYEEWQKAGSPDLDQTIGQWEEQLNPEQAAPAAATIPGPPGQVEERPQLTQEGLLHPAYWRTGMDIAPDVARAIGAPEHGNFTLEEMRGFRDRLREAASAEVQRQLKAGKAETGKMQEFNVVARKLDDAIASHEEGLANAPAPAAVPEAAAATAPPTPTEPQLPAWYRPEELPPRPSAEAGLAPPTSKEAAAARGNIEEIVGSEGGQAVRGPLGREIGLLNMQAKNAEKGVAQAGEGAEGRLMGQLAEQGASKGAKAGRRLERAAQTLRTLGITDRQIANLPERMATKLDRFYRDIRNAPAPYRHSIRMARQFTVSMIHWRDELLAAMEEGHTVNPRTLATIDAMIEQGVDDVRDFFFQVAGPEGELRLEERLPTPRFVPGGQPRRLDEELGKVKPGEKPSEARPLRAQYATEEKISKGGPRARDPHEMFMEFARRLRLRARNDGARLIQTMYGKRSSQLLGDTAGMTPQEIIGAMKAQGYVPWDLEAFLQSPRQNEGATMRYTEVGKNEAASLWDARTVWLPEHLYHMVRRYYGEAGQFEKFMRQIDKGRNVWRAAVLALRPAWHVNNIIGNSAMAMLGAGMTPPEYLRRVRQARALLHLPEAELDVAFPESVARGGLFKGARTRAAQNPKRVAKLQRIVQGAGPEEGRLARYMTPGVERGALEALDVQGEPQVPGAIEQRGAGAALLNPSDISANPNRLQRAVSRSYAFNGAVDDMSRLAVFLNQRAKLTEAEVAGFATRYPELRGLPADRLRTEGAVRMSLNVAGDFLRMTPNERQIFRRIFPFYAWIRHITKLAVRLPIYSPARVVWTMHLAALFGQPQGAMGLQDTLPLGADQLLQNPSFNPFADVVGIGDVQNASNPADALGRAVAFNLSPEIKVAAGLGGIDVNNLGRWSRPPGEPGGYGANPGDIGAVLGRPGEWPGLLATQFPQSRLLRGLLDLKNYGQVTMHYPLGQVRNAPKSAGSYPLPTGAPPYGPLFQYLGLPYPRQPNYYEAPEVRARQTAQPEKLAPVKRRRKRKTRRVPVTTAPRYGVPGS